MTNKQLAPKVRAWLKTTEATPEDARRSVGIVSGHASQTRQRSRWLPLPSLRRRTNKSHAEPSDYQPSPTPAANGHTPTVTGRTHSMLSPAKAITAGALVFALGGMFLIAQPFDQQGGGVPGAEEDEAMRPALVTGTMRHHYTTGTTGGRVETTDARLNGDVTFDTTLESIPDPIIPDIEGLAAGWIADFARYGAELFWGTVRIENDAGAWEGQLVCAPTVATHGYEDPCIIELTGTGAYEGLSAILVEQDRLDIADGSDETFALDGLIFAGNLPPDR
jgi:hypothetical protein